MSYCLILLPVMLFPKRRRREEGTLLGIQEGVSRLSEFAEVSAVLTKESNSLPFVLV